MLQHGDDPVPIIALNFSHVLWLNQYLRAYGTVTVILHRPRRNNHKALEVNTLATV